LYMTMWARRIMQDCAFAKLAWLCSSAAKQKGTEI
jgi:hypothetical protein